MNKHVTLLMFSKRNSKFSRNNCKELFFIFLEIIRVICFLITDVPASGMYFLTYEFLKKKVAETVKEGEKLTPTRELLGTVFAGGMAGVANWSVGMPQDVLKSRLQTAPEGTYPNGMRDVFRQLMKNEGPMALYKGFVPVMTRAVPANAACFIGLEICMRFLNVVAPNL